MSASTLTITGICGFIGGNLFKVFSSSNRVIGIDIKNSLDIPDENFYLWEKLDQLPYSDVIIHLAGIAHDISNTIKPNEYFDINLGLTKKIFDYFLKSKSKIFIFFSSVKAVADSVEGGILYENTEPDPKTPYGQSKYAAENYLLNQKMPSDKKLYILRPSMIHGPGNKGNLNSLFWIVKNGIPYPLGAFHNLRSYTSIYNLTYVIGELIEKDIIPGIYQVADDNPISTNELIELMADTLNKSLLIYHVPKFIVTGVSKIGDWINLPLDSERLKKLTETYVVDNTKLKSALGISSFPVSSREGLRVTFESFLK